MAIKQAVVPVQCLGRRRPAVARQIAWRGIQTALDAAEHLHRLLGVGGGRKPDRHGHIVGQRRQRPVVQPQVDSMIDALVRAAGPDPLASRLQHLQQQPRRAAVLRLAGVGPAVANAVFAGTGRRITRLPFGFA